MSSVGPTAATIAATTAITAVAQQQRRKLLAAFQEHGALSAATPLPQAALDPALGQQLAWYRREGVIREAGDGALYLDVAALQAQQAAHKRGGRIAALVVVLIAVFVSIGVVIGLSLK